MHLIQVPGHSVSGQDAKLVAIAQVQPTQPADSPCLMQCSLYFYGTGFLLPLQGIRACHFYRLRKDAPADRVNGVTLPIN